jgi:hypothetical protein
MTDWRLQGQERYLKGVSLSKQNYVMFRESWEHDHCEFCGAKLSERPEDLNDGYATADRYHWVCENCFKDFKDSFQWIIVPPPCDANRPK